MGKKGIILSGSPRIGGNSDILCEAFLKGALEAGNDFELIRVAKKKIFPCLSCYACLKGSCVQKDDMAEILQKIIDADVIVLASPVYFYSICAQLKAVLDRTVARWTEVKNKEFYFIATAGDESKNAADRTISCFRGYLDCVEGAVEKGMVCGCGFHEKGAIQGTSYVEEAYKLGKSV